MLNPRRWIVALAAATSLLIAAHANAEFPLKDGDIWVMAGDSITAQHLHSNYFEAFCYARYPKLKFGFRNSGVGGHTIPSTLDRFDYDIAAWKPTVVSVELGMNDQGGTPTDKFAANMGKMIERIRGIKARPVILSASPINSGNTMASLGGNKRLHEYADALKELSAKENIPYADQFHALIDVWGKNKPNEILLTGLGQVKNLAGNDKLEGVEHLRAFLAAHEKNKGKLVSMGGDPVHPGAPGQLMMAAALLKALGADPFVSSAVINVGAKTIDAKGCVVEALTVKDGNVAFDRLDERLPFPIPDDTRAVLAIDPTILDMSQYTLKVTGLKAGNYELKVEGGSLGTVTAAELEAGVNLTSFGPGLKGANPIAAQSKAILAAVSARAALVGQWRSLSAGVTRNKGPADGPAQLAALTKRVEEADEQIRVAARPRKMHYELSVQP
ncbi:MAG: GDSL-type esterase/lipase family protein [Planctomycetota bacterium]